VTVVALVVLVAVVGRAPSGAPDRPDLSTVALQAPPPAETSAPRQPPEPRVLLRIPVRATLAPVAPIAERIDPIEIEQLNASELSVAPLEPPMTITFDAIDIEPLAVQ
jgi:hypothetical protein